MFGLEKDEQTCYKKVEMIRERRKNRRGYTYWWVESNFVPSKMPNIVYYIVNEYFLSQNQMVYTLDMLEYYNNNIPNE